jgi:ParB family chromosome partitioning protein
MGAAAARALVTADWLAQAVELDMTGYWRPTARSYLGRVTKARILDAVREGVSTEAAERIAAMKKLDMAEAAEQLLTATGWLPAPLRTPKSDQGRVSKTPDDQSSATYPEAAE